MSVYDETNYFSIVIFYMATVQLTHKARKFVISCSFSPHHWLLWHICNLKNRHENVTTKSVKTKHSGINKKTDMFFFSQRPATADPLWRWWTAKVTSGPNPSSRKCVSTRTPTRSPIARKASCPTLTSERTAPAGWSAVLNAASEYTPVSFYFIFSPLHFTLFFEAMSYPKSIIPDKTLEENAYSQSPPPKILKNEM